MGQQVWSMTSPDNHISDFHVATFSYPQRTQSTWAASGEAARASDAGERFTRERRTQQPAGFVMQLRQGPTRIIGHSAIGSFGQPAAGHIAHVEKRQRFTIAVVTLCGESFRTF